MAYSRLLVLLIVMVAMHFTFAHMTPIKCVKSKCAASDEICIYDEAFGCIRKFKSKCDMDFTACLNNKIITDYSNDYCAMEAYLCEGEYERWTIFFGNE